MDWRPIDTFPGELEPDFIADGVRFYTALIYGRGWSGDSLLGYPGHQPDVPFNEEPGVYIGSTWDGIGFWKAEQPDHSDWSTYIKPSHWMPLPDAPHG